MASLKAEKPVESQSSRQVKKEPAKRSGSTPKAPSSKPAPKKTQKRSRPKQKVNINLNLSSFHRNVIIGLCTKLVLM